MTSLQPITHVAHTIEQQHAALRLRLKLMVPMHVLSSSDVASHIAFRSYRYRKLMCRHVHEKNARAEKPKAKAVSVKDKREGLAAYGGRS